MLIVALVTAWVVIACALALFVGRALAVSGKSDCWRHGHRDLGGVRRSHTFRYPRATGEERTAA